MKIKRVIPWNKGRAVGQKRPFSQDEILAIAGELERMKSYRDLCLFCLGIDTMLRGSDLVRLRVLDVMDKGRHPKVEFASTQQKTKHPVVSALTPYTQSALCCHVGTEDLGQNDYLFTPNRRDYGGPIGP